LKFIEKEANEKAQEIRDKTQSEYSLEKSRIVIAQKEKISVEFNRKQQQVLIDKRIAHSHEITKSRLEILQAREKGVRQVVEKAQHKLAAVAGTAQYKDLVVRLTLQAVAKFIDEKDIVVKCREEDQRIVKEALVVVEEEMKKYNKTNKLTLDTTFFLPPGKSDGKGLETCSGGIVLTAKAGKLVCDNTLDARLKCVFEDLVPIIRKTLFNEPDRVPTVVKEKEHAH